MKDGYFIIDGDGHVCEDPEGLRRHQDPRFRSRPSGGSQVDRSVGGKYGKNHWNPAIQLEDMDVEGIDIAALYPTRLLGGWRLKERAYSVDLHRAYNDWLAEFCSASPSRLRVIATVPMVDPDAAARELERAATQLGAIGCMMHTKIYNHQVNDPKFDDLYACAQQYDLPVAFHASGSEIEVEDRFETFLEEHTLGHTHEQMVATILMVYGGILERFPRLRVAFLEGMVGWIPMLAQRMDEEYEHRPFEAPLLTKEPSEYFKSGRLFFGAESGEWMIPTVIRFLGSDQTLLYSSDYPHWDGEFPNSTRNLVERTDLTDENKRNILGENARRFYPALANAGVPAATRS